MHPFIEKTNVLAEFPRQNGQLTLSCWLCIAVRLFHPKAKPAMLNHALTGHSLSLGRSYMKAESPHARGPSPIDFDGLSFPSTWSLLGILRSAAMYGCTLY